MSKRIGAAESRALLDNFNDPYTPIGDVPIRSLLETVQWLWSELEQLRDFADEDFPPANYAQIASYDPEGAARLQEAEKTLRLVHRQYQRRIHAIFRDAP